MKKERSRRTKRTLEKDGGDAGGTSKPVDEKKREADEKSEPEKDGRDAGGTSTPVDEETERSRQEGRV
jgi:hypothetical protein